MSLYAHHIPRSTQATTVPSSFPVFPGFWWIMDPGKLDPAMKGKSRQAGSCLRDVDTRASKRCCGCWLLFPVCRERENRFSWERSFQPKDLGRRTTEMGNVRNKMCREKNRGVLLRASGMSTLMAFHWLWLCDWGLGRRVRGKWLSGSLPEGPFFSIVQHIGESRDNSS